VRERGKERGRERKRYMCVYIFAYTEVSSVHKIHVYIHASLSLSLPPSLSLSPSACTSTGIISTARPGTVSRRREREGRREGGRERYMCVYTFAYI